MEALQEENKRLKAEINLLNERLRTSGISENISKANCPVSNRISTANQPVWDAAGHRLSQHQVVRYSRQIILDSFGVVAQSKLCHGSVLIVGAGGLGSPAALYLAAAGVGRIGIVDRDTVELSNIHRQVIHTEKSVGIHKVDSAAAAINSLNSLVTIERHYDGLTAQNAVSLVSAYDVIIDASDNAPTRYLLSDACAIVRKPLVSGAAIGLDGQLTVYCHGEDGPCYRCLFPESPRPESCARCADAGVLGVVPGIIGTFQALEAIKILSEVGTPMSRRLMLLDASAGRVHIVSLRKRSSTCLACGATPSITKDTITRYSYYDFTGQTDNDGPPKPLNIIDTKERITAKELESKLTMSGASQHRRDSILLVDVRPMAQWNVCRLPESFHAPFAAFDSYVGAIQEELEKRGEDAELIVLCRRGNDSQRAVQKLRNEGVKRAIDVIGGLEAWAAEVDTSFPTY